jgi:uncharacterized protein (TIGR02145 family)
MKKQMYLFSLIFLSSLNITAQDIVLTFQPKDATYHIDSISAIKVNSNETAFTENSNTINMSSFTTGTKFFPTNTEKMNVYPNPFENYTQLSFHSERNDNIKVSLINAAGQIVAEKNQNIISGIHQFNISTNKNGLYILNVTGDKAKFSQKIISTKDNGSLNKIEFIGYSSMFLKEKSSKIDNNELIFFYIYSGDKITKIADSPTASKTYEVEFYECKDIDGKSYPIVQIGDQWWMAENLAYLPSVSQPSDNSDTEPYYYVFSYRGSEVSDAKATENYGTYGVLYNWPAAMNACPNGWHLPTDEEWKQLEIATGMSQSEADIAGWRETNEGTKLKATSGWDGNGINGTDDFGFSALPGGHTYSTNGSFAGKFGIGLWWSATVCENPNTSAWLRWMYHSNAKVNRTYNEKSRGLSVRCVKD